MHSVVQLQQWLTQLGLPRCGPKNDLVSRINTVPVDAVDGDEVERTDGIMELLREKMLVVKRKKE